MAWSHERRATPGGAISDLDLYTSAQCRELDRIAIVEHGIPGFELMLRAGRAAFDELTARWPRARSVTVFCGKGNNAGDGYVIAGLAKELGFDTQILQVGAPAPEGDAEIARRWAAERGAAAEPGIADARGEVFVDALLGTGLQGPPRPEFAAAVRRINAGGRPVLAVDVPTGVGGDTGAVLGEATRADVTVSFIGPKLGLHTGPALAYRGDLVHAGLGVPRSVLDQVPGCPLLTYKRGSLPPLAVDLYKHRAGHLVIAGGDLNMGGAPLLAAEAALRAGAGLVSVVTRAAHRPAILARRPEIMVQDADDADAVADLLEHAAALVVGPGIGRGSWGESLFRRAVAAPKPMLIDADGLRLLANLDISPAARPVITPHAAEAAQLLRTEVAAVEADRPGSALRLAKSVGGVAVLKGPGTVCAAETKLLGVCGHGNPGMATAGMGDVLGGVIGALLAQGLTAAEAATIGVCLHGRAADLAAERVGERGLVAADLSPAIAELLA